MTERQEGEQTFRREDLDRVSSERVFYYRMPDKMRRMLNELTKKSGELEAIRLDKNSGGEYEFDMGFVIRADLSTYIQEEPWLDDLTRNI